MNKIRLALAVAVIQKCPAETSYKDFCRDLLSDIETTPSQRQTFIDLREQLPQLELNVSKTESSIYHAQLNFLNTMHLFKSLETSMSLKKDRTALELSAFQNQPTLISKQFNNALKEIINTLEQQTQLPLSLMDQLTKTIEEMCRQGVDLGRTKVEKLLRLMVIFIAKFPIQTRQDSVYICSLEKLLSNISKNVYHKRRGDLETYLSFLMENLFVLSENGRAVENFVLLFKHFVLVIDLLGAAHQLLSECQQKLSQRSRQNKLFPRNLINRIIIAEIHKSSIKDL
ncbi:hypothetical protein GEMRC1_010416 [Eukaryota sp. GEM-RC1]